MYAVSTHGQRESHKYFPSQSFDVDVKSTPFKPVTSWSVRPSGKKMSNLNQRKANGHDDCDQSGESSDCMGLKLVHWHA